MYYIKLSISLALSMISSLTPILTVALANQMLDPNSCWASKYEFAMPYIAVLGVLIGMFVLVKSTNKIMVRRKWKNIYSSSFKGFMHEAFFFALFLPPKGAKTNNEKDSQNTCIAPMDVLYYICWKGNKTNTFNIH